MTGPEHFKAAEEEFNAATELWDEGARKSAKFSMAMAQVHATLALAAATARGVSGYTEKYYQEAWREVTS